jgi:3-oxoadipate enol-lactonase
MPVFHANGLRHYGRLEGRPDGAPLLLVHPIGADHSIFDKVVPLLLERFQVLRPDLRGHGGSDVPPHDCTLSELAGDLLALTEQVGWPRFAACGISLGGLAVLRAALDQPQRVRALALCSTAAALSPPPGGWDQRAAVARAEGMSSLAAGMVERMFSPDHRSRHDPQIESLRTVFVRTHPEGYARCVAVLRDTDLRTELPAVKPPVTLLHGALDPLISTEKIEALRQGLRQSEVVQLPCGHFPPVEVPDRFAGALINAFTPT